MRRLPVILLAASLASVEPAIASARTEGAGPPLNPAQLYSVATERAIAGTGFLILHGGECYAVTGVQPFRGYLPTSLFALNGAEVQLGPRVHTQTDIQVLRVERRLSDPSEPLSYPGPHRLETGARLTVVFHEGILEGTLRAPPKPEAGASALLQMEGDARFQAAAHEAGSPVLSLASQEVVGVVTGIDDGEQTTIVSFEPLLFGAKAPAPVTPKMLAGTWLSGFGAMVTEVTLSDDGRFLARYFVANSFVGKVSGRWSVEGRELTWEFDEDNGLVERKRDVNAVLEISADRFSVRERSGSVTVFTRKPSRE